MIKAIVLDPADNVATVLDDVPQGAKLLITGEGTASRELAARGAIPFGHKIALTDFARGDNVIKYGEVIGVTSAPISAGDHVHIHNIVSPRFALEK